MTDTIQVLPVRVVIEGVQLADGRIMAVEVGEPRDRFAIVRNCGGEVEIVALRDDADGAVAEAQRIAGQLEALSTAGIIH